MNGKGLTTIIGGVVAFIVVQQLIVAVVTGTSTGDILLQTILTIVLAVAVIMSVLKLMD